MQVFLFPYLQVELNMFLKTNVPMYADTDKLNSSFLWVRTKGQHSPSSFIPLLMKGDGPLTQEMILLKSTCGEVKSFLQLFALYHMLPMLAVIKSYLHFCNHYIYQIFHN